MFSLIIDNKLFIIKSIKKLVTQEFFVYHQINLLQFIYY